MIIKDLRELRKREGLEIILGELPNKVKITDYALEKGFKINELVREIYGRSYEWYGFLIARMKEPEIIIDIGLPKNKENDYSYTSVDPEGIGKFLDELRKNSKEEYFINGWIHSHGRLNYRRFSYIDQENMKKVLNFVSSFTTRPIAKKEIIINNLTVVTKNKGPIEEILKKDKGSITIVTQKEPGEIKIFDTIYGAFAYSIVIGDERWSEQEIMYRKYSLISKIDEYWTNETEIELIQTNKRISDREIEALKKEIDEKINPWSPWRYWERDRQIWDINFWNKRNKKKRKDIDSENLFKRDVEEDKTHLEDQNKHDLEKIDYIDYYENLFKRDIEEDKFDELDQTKHDLEK